MTTSEMQHAIDKMEVAIKRAQDSKGSGYGCRILCYEDPGVAERQLLGRLCEMLSRDGIELNLRNDQDEDTSDTTYWMFHARRIN